MSFTDVDLKQAMDECAAEPVRIPGHIQSFGCLLVCDSETRNIVAVSENSDAFLTEGPDALLGRDMHEVLGPKIWHDVAGALGSARETKTAVPIGAFELSRGLAEIGVVSLGDQIGVELEHPRRHVLEDVDSLKTLRHLMGKVQASRSTEELFRVSCEVLRHVTGYDRVLVYRFDADYNGEVLSESKARGMESFLGLRFPNWDIPSQARAIMAELPIRMIGDVSAEVVPLVAKPGLPPLDLTFAASRGVSPIHIEYLRNMGVAATMTLTVMQGDDLWGIISFHHRRPRVPAPNVRQILISFADLFVVKLKTLTQDARLTLLGKVDALKTEVLDHIDKDLEMEDSFEPIAATVTDVIDAQGVAFLDGSRTLSKGQVPGQAVLARLAAIHDEGQDGWPFIIENLAQRFPELTQDLGQVAGALGVPVGERRSFWVFRSEVAQQVNWAGNPEKAVETVDGRTRLAPRGSFSTYLQKVSGRCAPWSEQDVFFAQQIWNIINISERRALMNTLTRQQNLMINELNHRVRNILALVRSVSRQARRRYGSLNSYAKSLEMRIQALAAAHDLASGSRVSSVSLQQLIGQELEPYRDGKNVVLEGADRKLRADVAPVVALVFHELVTNANKYGGLSDVQGQVHVAVSDRGDGLHVLWEETGGPPVVPPDERGFGTVLIEQAIPHELGGEASLTFKSSGIVAELFLPAEIFEVAKDGSQAGLPRQSLIAGLEPEIEPRFDLSGLVMILEDNFILADEMREQLRDLGAKEIEVFAKPDDALAFLEEETPALALLDVNLGSDVTSEPVALELLDRKVPFAFVTGYGEAANLEPSLASVPKVSKPVSNASLDEVLRRLL